MKKSRSSGFTLLELCIVLFIGSLFLSSALQGWKVYVHKKKIDVTQENLLKTEHALKTYLHMNYHYPCPAQRKIGRGQEGFGKALDACYNQKRSPYDDGNNTEYTTASAKGRNNQWVIMGVVPFRSLGIPDSDATDGWGRLLQYAVTEQLTNPFSFDQKAGAIDVVDENGVSRVVPSGTVHFVVYSTGADGKGGISFDGVALSPCPEGLLETENCNDDATFMDAQSRFKTIETGVFREKQTVTDYDDYILYKQIEPDVNIGSGLFILYQGTCPHDFAEIPVGDTKRPAELVYLSKAPPSDPDGNTDTSEISLCYSPYYSVMMSLGISYTNGSVTPCPQGWTEIGYKNSNGSYSYQQVGYYQVCVR